MSEILGAWQRLRKKEEGAIRLASLLAASPGITLPIINAVQETLLPRSEPVHVAEVLLGGILQPKQALTLGVNPDDVQYEFIDPDVRSELLKEAPVKDTTIVLSRYIEDNFRTSLYEFILELRRLMQSKDTNVDELRPIATIAAEVLQYRGAEYAEFVQAVRARYEPSQLPDRDLDPSPTFPALEDFEFIDAQLRDPAEPGFPPPLQVKEFTIVDLQLGSDTEPAAGLAEASERFEFKVTKIVREDTRWGVRQHQGVAYRYVEKLAEAANPSFLAGIARRIGFGNACNLEMVAIPGGTFVMGSPENEPERSDSESPLHEVTLEPFFMGRYPITQTQWRAVAGLPQVNRSLNPNPSGFKGDRLPVEQVSWYDAVEFCDRLSNRMGRQYRLPTEAEWEYACRAGTPTPFHFGDMILTEVANFDGQSTYADGPQGQRRGKTTPVYHFGIANDFGLSDMHGNVFEWCQDHWHENYEGAPTDGRAWFSSDEKKTRVIRGGSWIDPPGYCRSACRDRIAPDVGLLNIGFRVVCSAPRSPQ